MAFTSRGSSWSFSTKQISSRQQTWCQGVQTPLNLSMFSITAHVCLLQHLCQTYTLRLTMLVWEPPMVSIDLSTTMKLKELGFWCAVSYVQWITMALQTLQSESLPRITLRPGCAIFGPAYEEWHDLDSLLVQLQTSCPVRPKVVYGVPVGDVEVGEETMDYVRRFLPELTRRGLVDVVKPIGK